MANNNHFDLTLDTLAPTGSITRPGEFINANGNLTITKGDATFMRVWYSTNAIGSTQDANYPSTPEAAATTKLTNFNAAGDYYYHLTLIDSVNNESQIYNTDKIVFDPDAPTVSGQYIADPDTHSHSITNDLTGIDYYFEYSDGSGLVGVSGVVSADITGDDINPIHLTLSSSNTSYTGTLDFKSGTQDGTKTISIVVTDAAGNTSTPVTASITLDTQLDTPVITVSQTSGGDPISGWINYRNIYIKLTDADTGINGYKIWEGDTEPTDYTAVIPGSALNVEISHTLSSGDGTKTIRARVRDQAGTEVYANPVTVNVDTTAPANVSVTSDRNVISNVTGYTTATLTLAGSDATSGVASYTLTCGGTTILSGSVDNDHPLPASFSLTSANSMVSGANSLVWTLVDAAGNSTASTACSVYLDITAPTVTISDLNTWYNAAFSINTTLDDDYALGTVYAWVSDVSSDTTVPSGLSGIPATIGSFPIQSDNIGGTKVQSAANYMHVKVVDTVGNVAYDHEQFGYDNVAPTITSVAWSQAAYISTSAQVNISWGSDTSGVAYMRITGDITDGTANGQWEVASATRLVTLTSGDGAKRVSVQLKDTAGNESTIVQSAACELDTSDPTASLNLFEVDGTTAKPNISPVATFEMHIAISDVPTTGTDSDPKTYYKVWGDWTTGSQQAQGTSEPNEWTEFVPDSGQVYKSISAYCTSGDGLKQVNLKVKDSAGHELTTIVAGFTYDTVPPQVNVSNIDYNVISKVHVERRDASDIIEGKYADTCNFTFTPNETIVAWKVCAYLNAAAANAGSHADAAIPSTGGSVNMTGTGNSANPVSCSIRGADYETALGGITNPGDKDGAHIVVVYVQDAGGTWSAAAVISA